MTREQSRRVRLPSVPDGALAQFQPESSPQRTLQYVHVDVFSRRPFSGNSLTVFPEARALEARVMAAITREMRHFESIFLEPLEPGLVRARVFDLVEELDFAGHPVLGAACVLHALSGEVAPQTWAFRLNARQVTVSTEKNDRTFSALLNQGQAEYLDILPSARRAEFAAAVNLTLPDLRSDLPLQVVSTGLKYLIVPLAAGLERARIVRPDFATMLQAVGAQFAYLLDVDAREGRHWNNDGQMEDVATGSAAGTVGAYLVRHGQMPLGESFVLRQGRFLGRPSEIVVRADGAPDAVVALVGGDVTIVGRGEITLE